MPNYQPDFNNVDATIIILDKGEYEFIIGKPKSFQRENSKGILSVGVRFPMTVAEGPMANKRTFYTCYVHTDGAKGFTKQFWMAALDYPLTREGEAKFNAENQDLDLTLETELGECGEFWHSLTDRHVTAAVDLGVNPDTGEPNQAWKRFRGVSQAAPAPRQRSEAQASRR